MSNDPDAEQTGNGEDRQPDPPLDPKKLAATAREQAEDFIRNERDVVEGPAWGRGPRQPESKAVAAQHVNELGIGYGRRVTGLTA